MPLISRARRNSREFSVTQIGLSRDDDREPLAEYLPYSEVVERAERCASVCRDADDQMFLDLAHSGRADVLISGDQDLLTLARETTFLIETPEDYRRRVFGGAVERGRDATAQLATKV